MPLNKRVLNCILLRADVWFCKVDLTTACLRFSLLYSAFLFDTNIIHFKQITTGKAIKIIYGKRPWANRSDTIMTIANVAINTIRRQPISVCWWIPMLRIKCKRTQFDSLRWPFYHCYIYRVAQNKIPHQTIWNIFATSGQILKNYWSCLILRLLWIQRYTMYTPHLNYATTLPRKTITVKNTIFIIVFVLKSNETWKFDISDCHSLFEGVFKVSAASFRASVKSFDKAQYGLVDGVLW